jgi:hypothetical protein
MIVFLSEMVTRPEDRTRHASFFVQDERAHGVN